MNREIEFRGKRIDNGEWVYGNLIYSSDAIKEYETLIIPQKDADGFSTDYASNGKNKESYGFDNWFCVIPKSVGQYIGKTDINGKKIYEGDIVECVDYDDGNAYVYVVVFDLSELDFKATNGKEKYRGNFKYLSCCDEIIIKGNTSDNPELLEVGI